MKRRISVAGLQIGFAAPPIPGDLGSDPGSQAATATLLLGGAVLLVLGAIAVTQL